MNGALFLRYALYLMLLLPTMIIALMPLHKQLQFSLQKTTLITAGGTVAIILLLALVGTTTDLPAKGLLVIGFIPLFFLYYFQTKIDIVRKLFTFLNAIMITMNGIVFGLLLGAPLELDNTHNVPGELTALACIGVVFIMGLIYFKTLTVKIPYLLQTEALEWNWQFAVIIPAMVALIFFWVSPRSAAVVMTGRVRITTMAFLLLCPMFYLMIFNVFWQIAVNLGETARLREENKLMEMENKRYEELRSYMNETRTLRHDFRQHMLALDQYAKKGESEKLIEYIQQFASSLAEHKGSFAANAAVDAVASHYDQLAESQNTKVDWLIGVPEKLPLAESDFIAIFGNLVENALNAVRDLPEENRKVSVTVRMLSDAILGLTVKNPYSGTIKIGKNGLPKSNREGHGVGLSSVEAAVHRYNGVLDISTDDNLFSINVLLYLYE